jgi:hypothetical protein
MFATDDMREGTTAFLRTPQAGFRRPLMVVVAACPACGCTHAQNIATHAVRAALVEDDIDRALTLGLLDVSICEGCDQPCTMALLDAREARIRALAARDRFRAREARLERRRQERRRPALQRIGFPAIRTTTSPLPAAAGGCAGTRESESRDSAMTTPKRRGRNMPAADIHEMFARFAELDPKPTTELEYRTPFELLVAVILSAQATDVGVNKATRRLYPVANTPQQILALGENGLKRYISSIGLYNAKAANVIAMCRQLLAHHGGEVPRTRAELEALPASAARPRT